jgi:hypothetical protein
VSASSRSRSASSNKVFPVPTSPVRTAMPRRASSWARASRCEAPMNRYRGSGARLNGFSASPKKLKYTHPPSNRPISVSRSRLFVRQALSPHHRREIPYGIERSGPVWPPGPAGSRDFGNGAPELAPDGAVYRLWISVNKWISLGRTEKLPKIWGCHAMNVSIWNCRVPDEQQSRACRSSRSVLGIRRRDAAPVRRLA